MDLFHKNSPKGYEVKTALIIVAISAFFLGGCAATGTNGAFRSDGLPKQQYYVGGGFSVDYRARVPGSLFVVEENSGKLLVTKSLGKLEVYNFELDLQDEYILTKLKAAGIDPLNVKFSLYFVPAYPEIQRED